MDLDLIAKRLQEIRVSAGGTAGRDAARAEIDAELGVELRLQLARLTQGIHDTKKILGDRAQEMTGELVQTREQMRTSSDAMSRHQRVLVAWTVVLSLATIAYTVAAFLPFFSPSGRAWVLWLAQNPPARGNIPPSAWMALEGHESKKACEQAMNRLGGPAKGDSYMMCLPDTVEPRGPKGK